MAYSIIGGIFSGVASVAGTVMSPVCEFWHQQGVTQAGMACQAIHDTCWQSGHLVNASGVVSRLLTVFSPSLVTSTALLIGNKMPACVDINDESFCSKEIARIVGIVGSLAILGAGSTVTLAYTDHAERAAYAFGDCITRSFVNISSCEAFVETMGWSNTVATVAWGAVNLSAATWGLLVGNCLSCKLAKPDED